MIHEFRFLHHWASSWFVAIWISFPIELPKFQIKSPIKSVWARERCRISPPRFLAECCKRQLNQGSFVLLYFSLFNFSDLYWVCLSVFSCTVLFVSSSQVIGCEDRLQNDLYCVEWGFKLYYNHPIKSQSFDTESPNVLELRFKFQSWLGFARHWIALNV